jgi:hypothetical protein
LEYICAIIHHSMSRLTFLFAFLFHGILLFAHSADSAAAKDSLRIKYLLSSDFSVSAGNLSSINTVNQGKLNFEKRVFALKNVVQYRYGIIDTITNANEFTANTSLSLFPQKRVSGFVNGGFESSLLRAFQARALSGAGVSFRVFNKEKNKLEPFVNLSYEYTLFNDSIVVQNVKRLDLQTVGMVVGWTGNHKFFKNDVAVVHAAKFQQSLINTSNFRFDSNLSITVPIFSVFSFRTGTQITYENIVISTRRNLDFLWTFGVSMSNF